MIARSEKGGGAFEGIIDEAFIGLAGRPVASWIRRHDNLLVTRTFSKAHSLAGFRVGYAILPERLADDLNAHNDAYPLARPSQAAAIAALRHEDKIRERPATLRGWTRELAAALGRLGATYTWVTTALPEDNQPFVTALKEVLGRGEDRPI